MIGIRREDKNEWERRAPLTPDQVRRLVRGHGLAVHVQPSPHRAFPEEAYREAGAVIDDALAGCAVVLGIKEIPPPKLAGGKAYAYFSHTTKGQPHNMPMLRRLLELGATLLDYEEVKDAQGRRLIFFGRQAGQAGMLDALWALGQRLASESVATPLVELRPAHAYAGLAEALQDVERVGAAIRGQGWPTNLPPLICGITGTGNVSRGAEEVFDRLQPLTLQPDALGVEAASGALRHDRAYKVIFDLPERFARTGGGTVTLAEVAAHPERFENHMLGYLEHLTLLVNGMFWTAALPRLLGLDDLRRLWTSGGITGLRVIADISCDIDGAIEATVKATTPAAPVFVYDVRESRPRDGFVGDGPVILAVDNLPAELPREASEDFGRALAPFVEPLARCDWSKSFDRLQLPAELRRAVIAHQGKLAPAFSYLERHLER